MKWFKHLSGSLNNSIISESIERFGGDGYLVFFGILEMVSDEFDIHNPGKLTLRMKKITKNLQLSRQKTVKILRFFDEKAKTNTSKDVSFLVSIDKNHVTINCKRLADLCDNHTQKLLKDTSKSLQSNNEATSLQEEEVRRRSKNKNKNKDIKRGVDFPGWLNVDLWKEFKKFRVAIKAKMTAHAEKINIAKLKELIDQGGDQEAIVNQTIARGWKGFFPVQDDNDKIKFYKDAKRFLDSGEDTFLSYCKLNDLKPDEVKEWMNQNLK